MIGIAAAFRALGRRNMKQVAPIEVIEDLAKEESDLELVEVTPELDK